MQPHRNWFVTHLLLGIAAILTHAPVAFATRIAEAEYVYPYKDPYLATATAAILKGDEAEADRIRYLNIEILPHRNDVHLLEGEGHLRYQFQQQPHRAPMIIIVPGFGASAYSGTTRYLAYLMYRQGFHVLAVPSPFNWNFALAASHSVTPGFTDRDSADLYSAVQSTLTSTQSRYHAQISKIGLIGISHGALHAAYLAKMDAERKGIGLDITLLVNPPVDLPAALEKIDSMTQIGNRYSRAQRDNLESYAFGVARQALSRDIDDADYFENWRQRFPLSENPLKYLIGKGISNSVGDTVYVIELVRGLGLLRTPISWGYRSARFEEAHALSLRDYLKRVIFPTLRKPGNSRTNMQEFTERTSLEGIETELHGNNSIYAMHNADDFLITGKDLYFLEKVFGNRAIIYPHGGHMGNLWYSKNKQDIVNIFRPLFAENRSEQVGASASRRP